MHKASVPTPGLSGGQGVPRQPAYQRDAHRLGTKFFGRS